MVNWQSAMEKEIIMNNFWKDRNTLVTGASGLLGGWVAKKLHEDGANVICLIRDEVPHSELVRSGLVNKVTVVKGDICDQSLMERVLGEHEIDTVMHLAAQAIVGIANRNPVTTFEANIQGTWSVLEACRRSPLVRSVVVASSDKAYGDQKILPYYEDTPLQGLHPYDVSKSCADLITHSYAHTYGLPVAITRCGNFYGGGDLNWNRIVPGTIRSIINGEKPIIRSDGNFTRDYLYVEDGAAAYMLLAEELIKNPSLKGEAFNISNEHPITVIELVDKILLQMDSSLAPEIRNEASNEIREQYLDANKFKNMLNWTPSFDLESGIKETVQWYLDFFKILKSNK
jgi:CDP-glucose 4,6-dehydratase